MNDQIRKLAKRHDVDITIDGMGYGEGNIEGLAELIVRECASIYSKIDNGNSHLGTDDYIKALQLHFGVK